VGGRLAQADEQAGWRNDGKSWVLVREKLRRFYYRLLPTVGGDSLDGGDRVPQIVVTRTCLEMTSPDQHQGGEGPPAGARLELVPHVSTGFFRFLYAEVGKQFFWRDRLSWTDEQIVEYLKGPVWLWVLYHAGAPAGYFELKRHADGSVEIAYFGLMPHAIGKGLGKYLLSQAIDQAWALAPTRVWLHTCTLDHPAALPNYLKRGFHESGTEVYQTTIP